MKFFDVEDKSGDYKSMNAKTEVKSVRKKKLKEKISNK